MLLLLALWSLTKLTPAAEPLLSERGGATRIGRFHEPQDGHSTDLSPLLEDTMQLRKEVPLELVVNMFRQLVSSTFELVIMIVSFQLTYVVFVLEFTAHHVHAGRSTDGHDHQNGHRGPVNGALCPSRRPCRRGPTYRQQIDFIPLFFVTYFRGLDSR